MTHSSAAFRPCVKTIATGQARARKATTAQPAGNSRPRAVIRSRSQSSTVAATDKASTAPKPVPFTSAVVPSNPKKVHRQRPQRGGSACRFARSSREEEMSDLILIWSNATRVQVMRHASKISASARRPRITVHAVVAWTAPASRPITLPYRRRRQHGHAEHQAQGCQGRRKPGGRLAYGPRNPPANGCQPERQRRLFQPGQSADGGIPPLARTKDLTGPLGHEGLVIRQTGG